MLVARIGPVNLVSRPVKSSVKIVDRRERAHGLATAHITPCLLFSSSMRSTMSALIGLPPVVRNVVIGLLLDTVTGWGESLFPGQ